MIDRLFQTFNNDTIDKASLNQIYIRYYNFVQFLNFDNFDQVS